LPIVLQRRAQRVLQRQRLLRFLHPLLDDLLRFDVIGLALRVAGVDAESVGVTEHRLLFLLDDLVSFLVRRLAIVAFASSQKNRRDKTGNELQRAVATFVVPILLSQRFQS